MQAVPSSGPLGCTQNAVATASATAAVAAAVAAAARSKTAANESATAANDMELVVALVAECSNNGVTSQTTAAATLAHVTL